MNVIFSPESPGSKSKLLMFGAADLTRWITTKFRQSGAVHGDQAAVGGFGAFGRS